MAIKELQTRIALKYDSYENWTKEQPADSVVGKNLVLLAGEIGICEIPATNNDSKVAPTVLFKVGNGTKKFHELPWASAKAADVYGWAKASDVVLEGKTIKFVGTDKTITLNYVTEAEVKDITDPIAADVAALKTNLGANGTTGKAIAAVESRLDAIEGDNGAIATAAAGALADAKEYTDTREAAIKTAYEGYADKAEEDAITAANAYTDGKVSVINAKTSELETAIGNNSKAINDEVTNRTNADNAINAKLAGIGGTDEPATVVAAINTAKQAAIDSAATTAQSKVDALATGAVAQNTKKAGDNAAAIAQLQSDLAAEAKARGDKDTNLEERLTEVETFFKTAEGETLDTALDTLVEIQKYLTGDGDAASDLISRVSENEKDIARRARNTKMNTVSKNASLCEYKKATSFEAVIGYIYLLGDFDRLKYVFDKLSKDFFVEVKR
jgi:23S rRNA maturation mini-RNase III